MNMYCQQCDALLMHAPSLSMTAADRLALARALVADMPGVVVAEVPSQRDLAWEINQALGSNWAYSNYSGNEWEACRDMLDNAADAVRAAILAQKEPKA